MARFVLLSSGEYSDYGWDTLIDLGRDVETDVLEKTRTGRSDEDRKALVRLGGSVVDVFEMHSSY